MNDNWGFENNDDTQTGENLDGPKALREAYSKLKAQNEELNTKLTSFLEDQQKQKLAGVFESLGAPGAAAVYQGPPDPEKAKEWFTTMQSVFGNGSAQGNSPTPAAPAFTQDQQAAMQQMASAGSEGVPMGNFEAAASAVSSANSIDELIAGFQKGVGGIG